MHLNVKIYISVTTTICSQYYGYVIKHNFLSKLLVSARNIMLKGESTISGSLPILISIRATTNGCLSLRQIVFIRLLPQQPPISRSDFVLSCWCSDGEPLSVEWREHHFCRKWEELTNTCQPHAKRIELLAIICFSPCGRRGIVRCLSAFGMVGGMRGISWSMLMKWCLMPARNTSCPQLNR